MSSWLNQSRIDSAKRLLSTCVSKILCSWNWKGKLSEKLPQVTTVCQLFPASSRAVNLIFTNEAFKVQRTALQNSVKSGRLISTLPFEPLLHGFSVQAEHEGLEHFIYFTVPACPGLAGLRSERGWWQSPFPANVLLRVSLLGECSSVNIYSTSERTLKTRVPTVQAGLAGGHPALSACAYLWETGHCSDLPPVSGNFTPRNGLENSVSLILGNSWFSFLFQAEIRAVPSSPQKGSTACLLVVYDKPCWIISCGRDLPIPQAFASLR